MNNELIQTEVASGRGASHMATDKIGITDMTRNANGSVLVIKGAHSYPFESEQIRIATEHLGLTLQTVSTEIEDPGQIASAVSQTGTLAVMVSADALPRLNRNRVIASLSDTTGKHRPTMIFGIRAMEDDSELSTWSCGAVLGSRAVTGDAYSSVIDVQGSPEITGALAGMQIPAAIAPTCHLRLAASSECVLKLQGEGTTDGAPVLVKAAANLFLVPELQSLDRSWAGKSSALPQTFSSVAPFIFFLRHAAGKFAWHLDGAYANLTIDDPWLTQPYGSLDYPRLLSEMQEHNFHTTIAFVPWNFDRNCSSVTKLFRDNPDRFSICVHGNDHAHREFGDYRNNPLTEQTANIKQGLARMEAFHKLTGIPYDRFMVFPHGVAPEETFEALKKHDFLGTANSSNVPLGKPFPANPAFLLRPYTDQYGSLLSILRYPAEQPPSVELAIHAFLGNPLLFYCHQDLFHKGISTFNETAGLANRIAPETKWLGLGEISKHLHLLRQRQDGGFDVRMISNEMLLQNPTDAAAIFHVRHAQSNVVHIRSISVDASETRAVMDDSEAVFQVLLPPRQHAQIRVNYEIQFDVVREKIRKRSAYSYGVRLLSDFRDLYLSKTPLGQRLAHNYYHFGLHNLEVKLERKVRALLPMKQPSSVSGPAPK